MEGQESVRERVSLWPVREALKGYAPRLFLSDLQAGLTVAVFAVPQVMAYAMLTGVAPVNGLYAAIVMSVVAALWGSSPWVNTGPTNSAALLSAGAVMVLAGRGTPESNLFTLTILVGVIRLLMGVFRFGWILHYVPESAFIGFTVGAGLLISMGQLHHLLGVAGSTHPLFIGRMAEVLARVPQANPWAVGIGLGTLLLMVGLDRHARRWPVALFVIVLGTLVAHAAGDGCVVRRVRDIAPVPRGWPGLQGHWPAPVDVFELLPAALAVAFIGLVEAVSIGEVLAMRNRRRLNVNQEFFGQGLSQIAAAFFHGFPGSGSFSRSALVEEVGGRTCLANVVFAVGMAAAVLLFPHGLERIPVASLSGLLLYVGYKLVDFKRIRRVWDTSASDTLVMAVTCLVTVLVSIQYGIFSGMFVALVAFMRRVSELKVVELLPAGDGGFAELAYDDALPHEPSRLVVAAVHGDLFFGVGRDLRDRLEEIVRTQRPQTLVVRIRRAYSVDYSCWNVLFEFAELMRRMDGRLMLCGVRPDLMKIVREAGMESVLPEASLFVADGTLFTSVERAATSVLREGGGAAALSKPWADYAARLGGR